MYVYPECILTKKIIVPPDETQEMFHEIQVRRHTYTIHLMGLEQSHNLDRLGTVLDTANTSNYLHKKNRPDLHTVQIMLHLVLLEEQAMYHIYMQ